jgi:2,5-diketo-D-gluconate reductase B
MVETLETPRVTVPALGFGTWQLEPDVAYDAVRTALDVGYRHIDTAQMYGNEEAVGRAIADSAVDREDVFLVTKVAPENAEPQDVRASTIESLQRLRTDHLDLLLLHWPSDVAPLEETLAALTQALDEHHTRHIGVSNFPSQVLDKAAHLAPIVTDQVEHHPYLAVDPIRETAEEHDLFVTAYSPIAQGEVLRDDVLGEIAEAHGRNPVQITLAWLLRSGVAAIPRSSDPDHIAANFDVFDIGLTDEEMARIDDLEQGMRLIDPPFAPTWD